MLRKATLRNQVVPLWKHSRRDGYQIPGLKRTNSITTEPVQINSNVNHDNFFEKPRKEANHSKGLIYLNPSSFLLDNTIDDNNALSLNDSRQRLMVSNNNRRRLNPNVEKYHGIRNKKNLQHYNSLQFVITDDCTLEVSSNRKVVKKSSDDNKHSGYTNNRKEVSFISINQTDRKYSKQPWYVPNFDYGLSKTPEDSKMDILHAANLSKQHGSLKNLKKLMIPSSNEVEAKADICNFKRIIGNPQQCLQIDSIHPQKYLGQSMLNYNISAANNAYANHNRKQDEEIKEKSLNKPLQVFTDVSSAVTKDSNNRKTIFKTNVRNARKYSFQEIKTNGKLIQNKIVLTKIEKNDLNETVTASNIIQNNNIKIRDFQLAEKEKDGKRPQRNKLEDNIVTSNYISRGYLKPDKEQNLFELTGLKLPLQMTNKSFIPCHLKYFKKHSLQATPNTSRRICFNKRPVLLTVKNVVLHDVTSRQSACKEIKEDRILKWMEDCCKVVLDTSFSNILVSSF